MISFQRRSIKFGEVWFDEPIGPTPPDVLIVRHSRERPSRGPFSVKLSLMTDLTVDHEQLWKALDRDCRREIRRAQEADLRLNPVHPVQDDTEILGFARFYDRFAVAKGLPKLDVEYLRSTAHHQHLWMSSVSKNSEALAWNSYIVTGATARSSYGASICHTVDRSRRKEVAHAHRYLNWMDVRHFKDADLKGYDWGGIFPDESVRGHKGINDFKREFGGEPVEYYEYVRALTIRGALYLHVRPIAKLARNPGALLRQWKQHRARGAATIGAAHATLLMAGYLYDP